MKTSRAFMVGGAASAILTAGWALAPDASSTVAYASSSGTDASTDSTSTDSTTSDSSTTDSSTTYTGEAVQTRYGIYQVEITVSGSEVTDVTLVQEGANDHESEQIKSWALPELIQEVLDTQSADVTYLSGASYTSDGFAQSVADAFDQAGL